MNRMQERYQKEVAPALLKAFEFKNTMQVPRIEKVVLNIGLGSPAKALPILNCVKAASLGPR